MGTNSDWTCEGDGKRSRHGGAVVQENARQSSGNRRDQCGRQCLRARLEEAREREVLHEDENEPDEDEGEVELEVARIGADVVQGAHDPLEEKGGAKGAVVILDWDAVVTI